MCVCECVFVCLFNLQLYGARGVLQQVDSLRVAHSFSGGSTDTDDAVSNLEKGEFSKFSKDA